MSHRPNLLLITTDQHRWDWLGCHGTPGVETPHLDALAGAGVRFTNHMTNSTVCVPARIGLATGVAPVRLGTLGNDDVLPDTVPTYYQLLRDAGYRVGVVGKLDLNKPDADNGRSGDRPDTYKWGFTDPVEVEGKMHARGEDGRPLGPYGWWLEERGLFAAFASDYEERIADLWGRYLRAPADPPYTGTRWYDDSILPTDAFEDIWIGRRACQWLREVPDGSPFHLFVSFVGPHDPFDPPTEYAERFRDAPVPPPVLDRSDGRPFPITNLEYGHTEAQMLTARRQYTAALAAIDDQVGAIIDAIRSEGLADDTVILFSSDHGEMLGDHRLFQKSVAYEPAMRIPLIAAGPGVGSGVSDALTELVDVTATILDLVGLEVPTHFDGRTLAPVLADPSLAHRDAVVSCETPFRAIRTPTKKYIYYLDEVYETDELFDLADDPDETRNLIEADPNEAARLHRRLVEILGEELAERPHPT